MSSPYARFALTLVASLLAMFVISLEQVRSMDHFALNLSNLYITMTGVGVMGLIMLVTMRGMFKDAGRTAVTAVALVALVGGGFFLARTETFVGDRAFLDSMIPHHSRAILVCEESDLSDPEIIALCEQIVRSQSAEIEQMQGILERS